MLLPLPSHWNVAGSSSHAAARRRCRCVAPGKRHATIARRTGEDDGQARAAAALRHCLTEGRVPPSRSATLHRLVLLCRCRRLLLLAFGEETSSDVALVERRAQPPEKRKRRHLAASSARSLLPTNRGPRMLLRLRHSTLGTKGEDSGKKNGSEEGHYPADQSNQADFVQSAATLNEKHKELTNHLMPIESSSNLGLSQFTYGSNLLEQRKRKVGRTHEESTNEDNMVWRMSGLPLITSGFNSFAQWVDLHILKLDVDKCGLLLMLCWKIWTARNAKIWNGKMASPSSLVEGTKCYLADWINIVNMGERNNAAAISRRRQRIDEVTIVSVKAQPQPPPRGGTPTPRRTPTARSSRRWRSSVAVAVRSRKGRRWSSSAPSGTPPSSDATASASDALPPPEMPLRSAGAAWFPDLPLGLPYSGFAQSNPSLLFFNSSSLVGDRQRDKKLQRRPPALSLLALDFHAILVSSPLVISPAEICQVKVMAEEKDATSVPLSQAVADDPEDPLKSSPASSNSSTRKDIPFDYRNTLLYISMVNLLMALAFKACCYFLQSWVSKKFMTGCVVLFPVAVTFFVTWWFIQFVDGFFSPLYEQLGFDIFGLGFVTSLLFVFLVGVFVSSWLGATVFWIGEWLIKRMPFVKHIYSASKQISSAISPDQNTTAFKEVAIIRHPRVGEYAFGFITSSVILQKDDGDEELCSVFVPTNHLYIGDILLVSSKDIIRPNLSIREGIEIIVSGGMTMPQVISPVERVARPNERIPLNRIM
nr:protein LIKE COV 2-like [Ipomoea trifida]